MGEAGVQKIGALIPRENNVTSSTDCEAHSTWSMVVLIRVMGGGLSLGHPCTSSCWKPSSSSCFTFGLAETSLSKQSGRMMMPSEESEEV